MHEQDEQLGMILTQLGYLCDRLVVELPDQDPDFSHELNAIERARILSHLIDDYLARGAGRSQSAGRQLVADADEVLGDATKCQACGEWYKPDAPDDWGTQLIELCNSCYTTRRFA
jgi:hypothetical protein